MSSQVVNRYDPDYVTPPGEIMQEKLNELGMSQVELAERIGRTKKTVNEIIKGKAPIVPETALQLERVLAIPARFWNNAERQYRECIAREEERARLARQMKWLQQVPVREMARLGWIPARKDPVDQLTEVLNFFGVASLEVLSQMVREKCLAFRQSAARRVPPFAVLAWLRKGELEAQKIQCAPYEAKAFRSALDRIRALTKAPAEVFVPEIKRLCAAAGVAVVFVPEIPGISTWGVAAWLTPEKALIQLSLRSKTDDHLWFTFFHEAAHILYHPKREIYVDVEIENSPDNREQEANKFAADLLIPPAALQTARVRHLRSASSVRQFAQEIGIAPGIVVGRLQREKLVPWSHLNALKRRLFFRRAA